MHEGSNIWINIKHTLQICRYRIVTYTTQEIIQGEDGIIFYNQKTKYTDVSIVENSRIESSDNTFIYNIMHYLDLC